MAKRYSPNSRRDSEVSSSSPRRTENIKPRNMIRKYPHRSRSNTGARRSPSPVQKSTRGTLRNRYRRSPSQRSYTPDYYSKNTTNKRRPSPSDFRGRTDPKFSHYLTRATFERERRERDRRSPLNRYNSPYKRYRNYDSRKKDSQMPEENKRPQESKNPDGSEAINPPSKTTNDIVSEKGPARFVGPNQLATLNTKTETKNGGTESFNEINTSNNHNYKFVQNRDKRNNRNLGNRQGAWKRPFNQNTVDRTSTSPFLLRVFLKIKGEHNLSDFAVRSKEPIEDELQLYFWMDTTLRELVDLVKDVSLESRNRNSYWKFRVIYQDKQGKTAMNEVGTIHSTRIDPSIDNKTLEQIKFQIGDYIDISINPGKRQMELMNEKVEQNDAQIPKPSEDIENSLQDQNKLIHI